MASASNNNNNNEEYQLTSTTAPGKVFSSRADLAAHYKSDWHRYNLKRREAGLPVLLEGDFQARLEAAKALRQDKQAGKDHLKRNKKKFHGRKKQSLQGSVQVLQAPAYDRIKEKEQQQELKDNKESEQAAEGDTAEESTDVTPSGPTPQQLAEEAAIEIDPRQCLFDRHLSADVKANADRMHRKYGFFIPDQEYLSDLEGLLGYCHEKIKLGHVCLYCQRIFTTWQGCQKHMISVRHCKLRYEAGVDLEDLSVFYDFAEADVDFLQRHKPKESASEGMELDNEEKQELENGNDDEWEDITDDEDEMDVEMDQGSIDNDEDNSLYDGYEEEIANMGFDVTPLGELIFPDGRIIGHRSLRRYYKQRAPRQQDSTAVVAARTAAGERLYRGRVYNINQTPSTAAVSEENALALTRAGITPGLAVGRAGKGILVPAGPGGNFSQLSLYRYRAAVRKQRRGEMKGQKIFNKSSQNINRMDKKGMFFIIIHRRSFGRILVKLTLFLLAPLPC